MGITRERTIVFHFDFTGSLPSLKRIIEFERAVLDFLRIKTSIGTEIDILEEKTVHRLRNFRTLFGRIDGQCFL